MFGQINLKTNMSSDLICAVCLDSEVECLRQKKGFTKSPCGHSMCMTCFLQWYDSGGSCPTCRGSFKETGSVQQSIENGDSSVRDSSDRDSSDRDSRNTPIITTTLPRQSRPLRPGYLRFDLSKPVENSLYRLMLSLR